MRTEFSRAIAAAEQQVLASERINGIKRAVTAEVQAADPAVSIHFTDYFNHSFAPDMVLQWPREERERYLFVRPSASASWLLDDFVFMAPHRPVVVTLEDIPAASGAEVPTLEAQALASLDEAASAADTWVTDPSGLASISEIRADQPVLGLLSQALMRGGRGVSDGPEIESLARTTSTGFDGAAALSEPAARSAVDAIEGHLDAEQAGRLTRVLRAVWEGHGGDSARFPTSAAVGPLTDDDLVYLLGSVGEASTDFWRRVGRNITTIQLGRLRVDDPSDSLQALVASNLATLQAKGLRVVDEPFQLGESEDVPRWLIGRGCLALRGPNWTVYLAARKSEELPPPDAVAAPTLTALKHRARGARVAITEVEFGQGDRAVTYQSRERLNVLNDPELDRVAEDVGGGEVYRAVVVLEGGGAAGLDFAAATALGPTNATFPIISLLRGTLPLLSDLTEEDRDLLVPVLSEVPPTDDLFSTLE